MGCNQANPGHDTVCSSHSLTHSLYKQVCQCPPIGNQSDGSRLSRCVQSTTLVGPLRSSGTNERRSIQRVPADYRDRSKFYCDSELRSKHRSALRSTLDRIICISSKLLDGSSNHLLQSSPKLWWRKATRWLPTTVTPWTAATLRSPQRAGTKRATCSFLPTSIRNRVFY